jgi:hypothetical protein
MRRHPYDPQQRINWKTYPVRLVAQSLSSCHNQPRLLVQSMEGGFVSANCSACGKPEPLSHIEFLSLDNWLWVACPSCRKRMIHGYVPSGSSAKNYGFFCEGCAVYVWLSDLLPRWEELM